jgi:NADH-quinone oxidoreductase subunit J
VNETQAFILAATITGAISMWLLLPRGGMARSRAVGVILGLVSLGLFFSRVPVVGELVSHSIFWLLASTTIVSAAASVTLRSPVYCAIWFAMTLLGTAGLLLLQGAQFLGIATVVVYAGAILVTFLFVLMLAQPQGQAYFDRLSWEGFLSASAGALLVGILTMTMSTYFYPPHKPDANSLPPLEAKVTPDELKDKILADQHMARIGGQLFSRHLITVEVAGTLLMVALVGAIAIVAQAKTIAQHEGGRADG